MDLLHHRHRYLGQVYPRFEKRMHAAGGSEGAVETTAVEAALQAGLADLEWSGAGVLDGIAGADSAVGACLSLIHI